MSFNYFLMRSFKSPTDNRPSSFPPTRRTPDGFDCIHYKHLNPDLHFNTKDDYINHYIIKGRDEKRKYNIYMKYPDFDYVQYALNYPDLSKYINNKIFLENHWLQIGRTIGEHRTYKMLNADETQTINILVRTTYRPSYFKRCIQNILCQSYKNIRIICCYDDMRCLEYLNDITDERFEFFYINIDSKERYKYNLYINTLLEKVTHGWIVFLDDDDIFTTHHSLQIISQKMTNDNNFIYWSVKLGNNTIIHPPDINKITIGKISGIGFAFHSKYKSIAKWRCKIVADFSFVIDLFNANKFDCVEIKQILAQTQHNKMGLNGAKEK